MKLSGITSLLLGYPLAALAEITAFDSQSYSPADKVHGRQDGPRNSVCGETKLSPEFYKVFLGPDSEQINNYWKGIHSRPRDRYKPGTELSQEMTNGHVSVIFSCFVLANSHYSKSRYGTLRQQHYGHHLGRGNPWAGRDSHTNYYKNPPRTGVVRRYDFTISRAVLAPDGYQRDCIVVNGQFPGPVIEANWGDTIEVKVRNNIMAEGDGLTAEGVALHWHGFLQKNTNWEDGVPGVTMCPIAPGTSFTYRFLADLPGTTWYHSHYSAQWAAGIFGGIVIYGPDTEGRGGRGVAGPGRSSTGKTSYGEMVTNYGRETPEYDEDIGPILLSDWYHRDYFTVVEEVLATSSRGIAISNNNLINGKNDFDCSLLPPNDTTPCRSNAGKAKFLFQRGKRYRLRLVNTGAQGLQHFSIDEHMLTIIANDFVPVKPYQTKFVTLGIGQRTDVIVQADGNRDSYYMRANMSQPCSLATITEAKAIIYYDRPGRPGVEPRSTPFVFPNVTDCLNDDLSLTEPIMRLTPPTPDVQLEYNINTVVNGSNITLWQLGGVSQRINYNHPSLPQSMEGNFTYDPIWNVRDLGSNKSVRVVVNNNSPAPHPMHLHGFNMYILSAGTGKWDGKIVHESNPQRRDVQMLGPNGHMVMQFDAADNPGLWMFHCHIAWHASSGLLMQFVAGHDGITKLNNGAGIPTKIQQVCQDWNALRSICSRQTTKQDYRLADSIQDGIPIYKLKAYDTTTAEQRALLQDEWYRLLLNGPGVFVTKALFGDDQLVDRVSRAFLSIIADEKDRQVGDHFGSKNDRIWNALGKHGVADPASFIDYYSNPYLALVAGAWLGPGYRLTAQVNNVKPGSEAQVCHRDYHLGFLSADRCAQFPRAVHVASQFLTLQGAVAHVDMPLSSGPTRLLPYSQTLTAGYLAYRQPEFVDFFQKHYVSLPLEKGDGLFFNPALFHAAGENQTGDGGVNRLANLLQISSPFGKAMEAVDAVPLVDACWDMMVRRFEGQGKSEEVAALMAAIADGYPFPTNLDRNAPGGESMAPESEQDVLWSCLEARLGKKATLERLERHRRAARVVS
ncbi:hypothetical protein L249_1819 [Ophiocordyceps polyrhachis-furcata BCC 54312]|uniref:Uncharacterized protein n=1 Tax=Ophiocordyceps polyrhachis-furcata BCC 54312 TaxID=1330021 RepID=A0A367LP03_9HYPO|nr:hypothetical protein L249_1819 [Ophiocordyceps polyrhachis-furcata BCC 54312]